MRNRTAGNQSRVVLALAAAISFGSGVLQLHAQEDVVWTKEQLVERLARSEPEPLTRSLRGIVVGGGTSAAPAEPAATGWIDDLRIIFPFDSAEITPEAKANLDVLGQALLDGRLSADRFEIAGHTDGVGDETYNASLSERRAQAVVEYLETKFAIPAERLLGRGYGESYLINPDDPAAPENRRVEILNLGSG